MVHAPNDWVLNEKGTITKGGYWMAHFANLTYPTYVGQKPRPHWKQSKPGSRAPLRVNAEHINRLQKVQFGINVELLNFVNKYKTELAKGQLLYVGDTWLHLTDAAARVRQWNNTGWAKSADIWALRRLRKTMCARRELSLKNKETLQLAEYYANKPLWWVAFQDFRGRIYRMGALNFQGNAPLRFAKAV